MTKTAALTAVLCAILALAAPAFSADSTPPVSSVTSLGEGDIVNGPSCSIIGTAADSESGVGRVDVSVDGGTSWNTASGTATWTYEWTPGPDGPYRIIPRAVDNAGNEEPVGAGINVRVDNMPPAVVFTGPAAASCPVAAITGTASDVGTAAARVDISADGGASWETAQGSSSWTYGWNVPDVSEYKTWRVASGSFREYESYETQTIRVYHLLAAGGSQVRVGFAGGPVREITVHEAYIGQDAGGGTVTGNVRLTFGGNTSVTVPARQITFSDPVPWQASRGGSVVVTAYCANLSYGKSYYLPSYWEDGNAASVARRLANVNEGSGNSTNIWNALVVEVLQEGVNRTDAVALLGDSITFGASSTYGGLNSWARMLGAKADVYNLSLSGTTALYERSIIADLLDRGFSAGKAVVSLGGNDISLQNVSAEDIESWLGYIFTQIKGRGMEVYAGLIIPRGWTGAKETVRTDVNAWLRTLPNGIDGVIDFDAAVKDPENPSGMFAAFDADGVHPSDLGHAAMYEELIKSLPVPSGLYFDFATRAEDLSGNVGEGAPFSIQVDCEPPISSVERPGNAENLSGVKYTLRGTASDYGGSGIDKVEVSTDSGLTWHRTAGKNSWSYEWVLPVSGAATVRSRSTDAAGNVQTAPDVINANVTAYGAPELQHYNWDAPSAAAGCAFCHTQNSTFLQSGFRYGADFCATCHNAAGAAHEKTISGSGHSLYVNATTGGKAPTYGNVTAGETNNMPCTKVPDGKVVCVTCHNTMKKREDYGRTWEPASTTDNLTYSLQRGGWDFYGRLVPKVYRDAALWGSGGPTYSRTKKGYLVDPSEYTFDEVSGLIRFGAAQSPSAYIYVSLDYPYLRASSQDNRLCSDCHLLATHKEANCLTCHTAHNTGNTGGIRENVRTTDRSGHAAQFLRYTGANSFADGDGVYDGICEVCHTTTKYYRRDGGGFANHSGGVNYDGENCTACHSHGSGFARY